MGASSFDCQYASVLKELDIMQKNLKQESVDLKKVIDQEFDIHSNKLSANLDFYDVIFAIIFGIAGAVISTTDEIQRFSDQVHKHASGTGKKDSNKIETFLGELLTHNGDAIDIPNGKSNFINRNGENAYCLFHRMFWGHDILSVSGDNPFSLMCKDNGLILGIAKTFRHLIADTFSKQGLPLPGSSYFDFVKEDGKTSNHILSVVQIAAKESGNGSLAQEYYSHAFTIRMQDVVAQGLVFASAEAYYHFRGINDKIRKTQYKIISYATNFFAHAIIGAIRQNGFPYINWVAFTMIIKEIGKLFLESNRKTKQLERITDDLIAQGNLIYHKNIEIERNVISTGKYLKSHENSCNYISDYINEQRVSLDFINFLEEE